MYHPFQTFHIRDQFGYLAATLRTPTAAAIARSVFTTSKSHGLGGHLWFGFRLLCLDIVGGVRGHDLSGLRGLFNDLFTGHFVEALIFWASRRQEGML